MSGVAGLDWALAGLLRALLWNRVRGVADDVLQGFIQNIECDNWAWTREVFFRKMVKGGNRLGIRNLKAQ